MAEKLRQEIEYQRKLNQAVQWKCKMFGVATLILTFILALQVVQTDSELRKLFSWKNMQTKSAEIYD